jgi:hypothetical protein
MDSQIVGALIKATATILAAIITGWFALKVKAREMKPKDGEAGQSFIQRRNQASYRLWGIGGAAIGAIAMLGVLSLIGILSKWPISVSTTSIIYDDFNNHNFDGSYNQGRWTILDDSSGRIFQQEGILVVSTNGKAAGGPSLRALKYSNFTMETRTFVEAKLMVNRPQNGHAYLFLGSDLPSGIEYSDCTLGYGDKQALLDCGYVSQGNEEYRAEDILVDYGTWHTVRIEADPATMTFTYYVDGRAIGSHRPINAGELGKARFRVEIGFGVSSSEVSAGYIDDVRIGQP